MTTPPLICSPSMLQWDTRCASMRHRNVLCDHEDALFFFFFAVTHRRAPVRRSPERRGVKEV